MSDIEGVRQLLWDWFRAEQNGLADRAPRTLARWLAQRDLLERSHEVRMKMAGQRADA